MSLDEFFLIMFIRYMRRQYTNDRKFEEVIDLGGES